MKQRITITLSEDLIKQLDKRIDGKEIQNRSHEIEKILSSGFDDYISKPITKEQLEIVLSKRM